ncbi:MAG: peptidoglycan recognition protein family protein [Lachnospiraceae bacterium]|nr:peptidoglycan recognition protein family protein [Lachnospiraceae bacterium]
MSEGKRREADWEPEIICTKRNPYLVDYEKQRKLRERRADIPEPQRHRAQEPKNGRHETMHSRSRRIEKRKRLYRKRLKMCIFAFCIVMVLCFLLMKQGSIAVTESNRRNTGTSEGSVSDSYDNGIQTGSIQGLPAVKFAAHPDWTEDFLTPNEYSRPGEPLTEVTNIFVHYTANPGTSAAQNRSYFEQQKDVHEASVSAHFIIGYEGEIIQCIPLDEIAYAVQTRNYDSVSIECCYKAKDGSFTQETYDSLISLLAWLTDIYDLETEDILRHYDCGGKKCPLYYTEHPDAWERLKEDVANAIQ